MRLAPVLILFFGSYCVPAQQRLLFFPGPQTDLKTQQLFVFTSRAEELRGREVLVHTHESVDDQ